MESNPYEDSKSSSSEETDRSEQASDDMGTGRSYECVFCKRGFTTAQALGGHMNIHRKDRAKSRPISSVPPVSDKVDENSYGGFRSYMQLQSYPTHYAMAPEVQVNYQTFFPESTWGDRSMHSTTAYHGDNSYGKNPMYLNPFGDHDWRSENLSLRVGQSDHVPDDDDDKEKRGGTGEEDDELDLELRLGHDP
ncbi:hypothetical protein ACOSP7_001377 [Xanthoceras sorbifolium]|uniref:C2H2-type domain-containing protein n=1 Tax=Xanthoceras sorbifolium TaxID=99658 RepID=A0ABQ8IM27_9ROSI|nr:hypothetical protein JRO89_XS01G0280000 [Xanthoceras sorbifolium]